MALPPTQQTRISRFFTPSPTKKRGNTPIDLTETDNDVTLPPAKKHKGPATTSVFFSSSLPSDAQTSGRADKWKFIAGGGSQSAEQSSGAEPDSERKKRRLHEAFKHKLLGENNPLSGYTSGEDSHEVAVDSDIEELEDPGEPEPSGSEDDKFKEIQEMFSLKHKKGKGKGRAQSTQLDTSASKATGKSKSKAVGPSGRPYTPLELQVLKLKADNPGTILMITVGYKYRFFGEDAKVASKELGIVCFQSRNFLTASVPVIKRDVYVKK
jgi:DNA mismatch repair protein MSH3